MDSFDSLPTTPLLTWVFSNYDDVEKQKQRIEYLQHDLTLLNHLELRPEFAVDILKCIQHCKAALSVLECRIISSVKGRVLLGSHSHENHDEDFHKEEWLEVEVRRGSVNFEKNNDNHSRQKNTSTPVDDPDAQEWIVYISKDLGEGEESAFLQLCDQMQQLHDQYVVVDRKWTNVLNNPVYCVVKLPKENVSEHIRAITSLSKYIIGVEQNVSGHMKAL